jgi:hypothetical protein
MLEYFSM